MWEYTSAMLAAGGLAFGRCIDSSLPSNRPRYPHATEVLCHATKVYRHLEKVFKHAIKFETKCALAPESCAHAGARRRVSDRTTCWARADEDAGRGTRKISGRWDSPRPQSEDSRRAPKSQRRGRVLARTQFRLMTAIRRDFFRWSIFCVRAVAAPHPGGGPYVS